MNHSQLDDREIADAIFTLYGGSISGSSNGWIFIFTEDSVVDRATTYMVRTGVVRRGHDYISSEIVPLDIVGSIVEAADALRARRRAEAEAGKH